MMLESDGPDYWRCTDGYAQLGGKYAVIGSDAHYKEHVGRRMREALGLADEAGPGAWQILENARCGR